MTNPIKVTPGELRRLQRNVERAGEAVKEREAMKKLVSKKGSQEIYVTQGNGCIVIRAFDKRKGMANTVSIFDELLPGLIAQLSAIAVKQRRAETS